MILHYEGVGGKSFISVISRDSNNTSFFISETKYILIIIIIKVQEKDERSFPQNTKSDQSKTRHLHYTRTYTQGIHHISQSPNCTKYVKSQLLSLLSTHFKSQTEKPTELNNIKWHSSKSDSTRGPKRGVEVK